MTDFDCSEIRDELNDIYYDLERLIYVWRRYNGIRHEDTKGKFYTFEDLDELNKLIKDYFNNPEGFDREYGEMKDE